MPGCYPSGHLTARSTILVERRRLLHAAIRKGSYLAPRKPLVQVFITDLLVTAVDTSSTVISGSIGVIGADSVDSLLAEKFSFSSVRTLPPRLTLATGEFSFSPVAPSLSENTRPFHQQHDLG